jgi:hypothetical protein
LINILASGVLTGAPRSRTSANGKSYVTGSLRASGKESDIFVSFICFAEEAQAELLALHPGDGLSIAGPGKLTEWTGKDGTQKHGLSVVVDRLLVNKPRPRPKAAPREKPAPAPAMAGAEFEDEIPF